jgi:hypothetical protein
MKHLKHCFIAVAFARLATKGPKPEAADFTNGLPLSAVRRRSAHSQATVANCANDAGEVRTELTRYC